MGNVKKLLSLFRQNTNGLIQLCQKLLNNSFIYAMHDHMLYQIRISEEKSKKMMLFGRCDKTLLSFFVHMYDVHSVNF